jgi:hypothetical protein
LTFFFGVNRDWTVEDIVECRLLGVVCWLLRGFVGVEIKPRRLGGDSISIDTFSTSGEEERFRTFFDDLILGVSCFDVPTVPFVCAGSRLWDFFERAISASSDATSSGRFAERRLRLFTGVASIEPL